MHRNTKLLDSQQPALWWLLDLLATWRHADDLTAIAEDGDQDAFVDYVRTEMLDEFGDEAGTYDSQDHYWQHRHGDIAADFARRLLPQVEHRVISAVFGWVRYRRRLRFVFGLVRKEAQRLRDLKVKPKARVAG